MDLYTTSFTLPRSSHTPRIISPFSTNLPLPGSTGPSETPLPSATSTASPPRGPAHRLTITPRTLAQSENDWKAVQELATEITTQEGCLVTVTQERPGSPLSPLIDASPDPSPAPVWNFHLSGNYLSVMAARGAVLRECSRKNRFALRAPRAELLESPLAAISALKPEVQRRLEGIAGETGAHIAVATVDVLREGGGQIFWETMGQMGETANGEGTNEHSKKESAGNLVSAAESVNGKSGSAGTPARPAPPKEKNAPPIASATFRLESERMCEITVIGKLEGVEVARVLLLVLLDELSGLHAEPCVIDYKLHAIIAGRRRTVIQSIQEETGTNIYLPIPLVGIHDRPQANGPPQQSLGYRYGGSGMLPLSSQNTGMTQMTGFSQAPSSALGNGGWHMAQQITGSAVGHGTLMGGGFGPPHGRGQSGPVYNPHHHVQYPYLPQQQPINFDHHHARGMPYPSPAPYGHQQPVPVSTQNTGVSNTTGFYPPKGAHPRHMGGLYDQQQHHHTQHQHNHHHNQHFDPSHYHYNQHQQQQHMGGGHSPQPPHIMNPYLNGNGQNHVHVGLGGAHMGMNTGMGVGRGMNVNAHEQGMRLGLNTSPAVPGHYGQGPHPGLSVHAGEQGSLGKANQIWITGEFFGVQRARDMLLNIAMQKSKLVISRDTAILPRKFDWLLTEKLEEVKAIMSDNGTYMQVPSVGSQASLITVFGDHRVNIERTIRSIMALACQFYVASVWLLPSTVDVLQPQQNLDPTQMEPILKRISYATGAELVFKSNCFEMHGPEEAVRAAVFKVLELDMISGYHHEIRFQVELANEHRDFISGKKNGKINKIMKLAGVKIKFETFNDYNFLMDVAGTDIRSLHGLSMLKEELPAEISFHVPESHHKRIIGVAGKNIQRIMKLYGVYVKFSNAEEFAAIGGYADNEDNVVARTPAKNAVNLKNLKQSIMELVTTKDKEYMVESISVPRRYHRTLQGEKSIFIHDIEKKTNSHIRFPYRESASDILTIFGPEMQVHTAAAMLLDHVPFEADLRVLSNPEMSSLVASPDFNLFSERIKRDHQIAISPSGKLGQGEEMVIKFRCQRSSLDLLDTAQKALEEFFAAHNIEVYPANVQRGEDPFADAFHHFKSKALATRAKAATQAAEAEETVTLAKSRNRPIPNDVKALFDGPAQPGVLDDTSTSGERGFAGPLSYHGPRRSNTAEYWQTQSPQPIRSDIIPNVPTTEPSKRESDPLIQDKVRQATVGPGVPLKPHSGHRDPRAASTRTQSLDITSLNFSRTLSSGAGGFGAMLPGSPAVALANSPNTAGGQYFPSASGGGSGAKGYSGLDGVRNGIGSIHL